MKKKRNSFGFTMAELLVVVAIIAVLGGVGAVAVQTYQKSMAQAEVNTVAKEIFYAAQNHLTMAESQGYLSAEAGEGFYGTETSERRDDDEASSMDVYYFAVTGSAAFTGNTVLDLMLPFGSIDESIRSNGNYVVRYQANPARVLDVWYGRAASADGNYKGRYTADPSSIGMTDLLAKSYGGNVIGHYGDDTAQESGMTLSVPSITVENAERLTVTITNADYSAAKDAQGNSVTVDLKLLVTGETSGAMAAIPVLPSQNNRAVISGNNYVVVLDDITQPYEMEKNDGGHFAEIKDGVGISSVRMTVLSGEEGLFIPGENITVQAVAFSTDALANIAYSNEVTTNSLFADLVTAEEAGMTGVGGLVATDKVALISNFRHFENLDQRVSGVNDEENTARLIIAGAKQTADLAWEQSDNESAFTTVITDPSIYQIGATTGTAEGCFLPVNLNYALVYDGMEKGDEDAGIDAYCHSITGVKVAGNNDAPYSGQGGLFGEVTGAATIRDLELIDFSINSTGNAGALAGSLPADSNVINVLAHNSANADGATVTSSEGSAGGLIGKTTGTTVEKCAAALVVSGGANAGGLIGESHGSSSVTASFSGGHTIDKKDAANKVIGTIYGTTVHNVTAPKTSTDKGNAGGLIGDAGVTDITNCYSTCSASGKTAGGLTGCGGKDVTSCYATGLVDGTTAGAFAGEKPTNPKDCQYFGIINVIEETVDGTTTIQSVPPVPGQETVSGITALDADLTSYASFIGVPSTTETEDSDVKKWTPVVVKDDKDVITETLYYDSGLGTLYQNEYNLKTVAQLGADVNEDGDATADTPADFVAKHYGDWPAPEILVVNAN